MAEETKKRSRVEKLSTMYEEGGIEALSGHFSKGVPGQVIKVRTKLAFRKPTLLSGPVLMVLDGQNRFWNLACGTRYLHSEARSGETKPGVLHLTIGKDGHPIQATEYLNMSELFMREGLEGLPGYCSLGTPGEQLLITPAQDLGLAKGGRAKDPRFILAKDGRLWNVTCGVTHGNGSPVAWLHHSCLLTFGDDGNPTKAVEKLPWEIEPSHTP